MLARVKQLLGSASEDSETDADASGDGESESAEPEPVTVAFRLAYRPFIDANGWETLDNWETWSLDFKRRLPLTRSAFRRQLDAGDPLGYYKLFPVDENSHLQPAEWGLTHGTKAQARQQQQRREHQQAAVDQEESNSMPISQAAWDDMQETFLNADIQWDRDDSG